MNSPPNHQLLELSRKTGPVGSFATICVSADNANAVFSFLLTHQIPFSMLPVVGLEIKETIDDKPIRLEKEYNSMEKETTGKFGHIYQKYLVEGIEQTLPKIEEIAVELGVCTNTFNYNFRKIFGKSFYQIYIEKRMGHAAELLRQGLKAGEVSDKLGYAHPIKFNRMFQKYFGMTPKKYQMMKLSGLDLPSKKDQKNSEADHQ